MDRSRCWYRVRWKPKRSRVYRSIPIAKLVRFSGTDRSGCSGGVCDEGGNSSLSYELSVWNEIKEALRRSCVLFPFDFYAFAQHTRLHLSRRRFNRNARRTMSHAVAAALIRSLRDLSIPTEGTREQKPPTAIVDKEDTALGRRSSSAGRRVCGEGDGG